MATDKRKRAIRALATERGISYTTAMRLHDGQEQAPTPAPSPFLVGGTPVSRRDPASYIIAEHEILLDGPLAVLGEAGSGSSALVCQIATQGLMKGADVYIISDHFDITAFKDAEGPGKVRYISVDGTPPHATKHSLIELGAVRCGFRETALQKSGVAHWNDMPHEVLVREGIIDRPILVIDDLHWGESDPDDEMHSLALKTCRNIRRTARVAGVSSVSLMRQNATGLLAQFERREYTRLLLTRHSNPDPDLIDIIDALAKDPSELKSVLPTLRNGEALILEPSKRFKRGSFTIDPTHFMIRPTYGKQPGSPLGTDTFGVTPGQLS